MNTIKTETNKLLERATDELKGIKRLFPIYFKSNDPFSFGIETSVFDQTIKVSFIYQNFDSVEEAVNTLKNGIKEPVYDHNLTEIRTVFRIFAVNNEINEELTLEEIETVLAGIKEK